jgi:hypothetical protein
MSDMKIFDDKTFQDLTRDIYENALKKKKQIDVLIKEMNKMITSIDDVIIVAPIIKEYMEVSVKNDEHLVKLANVLQRMIAKSIVSTNDSLGLSDNEKEELMLSLNETIHEVNINDTELGKINQKVKLSSPNG